MNLVLKLWRKEIVSAPTLALMAGVLMAVPAAKAQDGPVAGIRESIPVTAPIDKTANDIAANKDTAGSPVTTKPANVGRVPKEACAKRSGGYYDSSPNDPAAVQLAANGEGYYGSLSKLPESKPVVHEGYYGSLQKGPQQSEHLANDEGYYGSIGKDQNKTVPVGAPEKQD
jgi:hypothetical protein